MRITDTVDLNRQGVLEAVDMVPTAGITTVGVIVGTSMHSAVKGRTVMSLLIEDVQYFGVAADRPTGISPLDDSRQTDTRHATNAGIVNTRTRMTVRLLIRIVMPVERKTTSGAFVEARIGPRPNHNDGRVVLVWDEKTVTQRFKSVRN